MLDYIALKHSRKSGKVEQRESFFQVIPVIGVEGFPEIYKYYNA